MAYLTDRSMQRGCHARSTVIVSVTRAIGRARRSNPPPTSLPFAEAAARAWNRLRWYDRRNAFWGVVAQAMAAFGP
jgi:hypothetical protein